MATPIHHQLTSQTRKTSMRSKLEWLLHKFSESSDKVTEYTISKVIMNVRNVCTLGFYHWQLIYSVKKRWINYGLRIRFWIQLRFESNENWERNKRWAFWEIFAATKVFLFLMIPINQWSIKSEKWEVQKNYESGFGCAFWLSAPLPALGEFKFTLKPFVGNGEIRI